MNHLVVRKKWHEFRSERQHVNIGSTSLIPSWQDTTVMFNIAGMQPLVPYLMWQEHPDGWRLENMQKCLRTVDIEDVWDERHLTFFEMMGNRSLNTYFKKESLTWSREFLTDVCGLDKDRIGLTVFGGYTHDGSEIIPFDQEAYDIAVSLGIDPSRIKAIPMHHGEKCDNFWGPAAAVWPCGPCAEFHYDRGDVRWPDDRDMWVNDRYTEIRNNVFMNMYKSEEGEYAFMERHNIDTWMWFERLLMVLQEKDSVFETDLFVPLLASLEKKIWSAYPVFAKGYNDCDEAEQKKTIRMRIIVDHMRSATMMMYDGVVPSNEWRWYVLRRLLRRAMFHYSMLHPDDDLDTSFLLHDIVALFVDAYVFSSQQIDTITHHIIQESTKFAQTLRKGTVYFEQLIAKQQDLRGQDLFMLYETYGFPVELITEMSREKGIEVDLDGFEKAKKEAQERSRSATWFEKGIDRADVIAGAPQTLFVWYDHLEAESRVVKDGVVWWRRYLIFDKTPFYATGGWQQSDTWTVILDDGVSVFIQEVKNYNWVYIHFVGEESS